MAFGIGHPHVPGGAIKRLHWNECHRRRDQRDYCRPSSGLPFHSKPSAFISLKKSSSRTYFWNDESDRGSGSSLPLSAWPLCRNARSRLLREMNEKCVGSSVGRSGCAIDGPNGGQGAIDP